MATPAAAPPAEVKKDLNPKARLYCSNLKWELNDEEIKKIFEEFGKVAEARVVRERRTNFSRGYGFVTFETEAEAKKALDALNGKELQGRPIRVELARSTGPHPPGSVPAAGDLPPRRRGGRRGRGRRRGGRRGRRPEDGSNGPAPSE